jgi:hypothetical protein
MYNLQKNNYHQKSKSSNIQTPLAVSQFIFELLKDEIKGGTILDPCAGQGSLLKPWKETGYLTWGIDIAPNSNADAKTDFFTLKPYESEWNNEINLVLCNPPFNGYSHKLGSEVWLDKIIELFGKEVPLVLFAPVGFRVNLTEKSSRWKKLSNGDYPIINSIITLPKNIFEGVIFHVEVLIFNIKGLQPHYFYHD